MLKKRHKAIILTEDQEFFAKYAGELQKSNYAAQQFSTRQDWQKNGITSKADFYIIDNIAGQFPHRKFINYLKGSHSDTFLLNVGEPAAAPNKAPFPLFNLNNDHSGIPLQVFLDNADKVLRHNKAQIELASMVLHDVRSPLNSLIGYLELMINETFGQLNEGQKNILEKAMVLGDATLDMLEDLNEVYRDQQEVVVLQKQPFCFQDILEAVLVNIWVKADQKNIKIRKIVPEHYGKIHGDDYQIQRVLTNLLTNAIKYSPEGSAITIHLSTENENYARFSIVDNGGGVPENQLAHLFDKYFRVKQKEFWQKGSGLGLYICKAIVKAHRGKIWAENNDLGGLSIHFTLPFAE